MLKISLLGKTKIEYNGEFIESQMSTKTTALICLLIMNRERCLSRDKIVAYLWPDSSEEAARYNLRYNLWLIKKMIGPGAEGEHFLLAEKDCCGINANCNYSCDLLTLRTYRPGPADTIEELLGLRALFRGDFLEGWYLKHCHEFNEMILFERMACENKQVEVLRRLAGLYEAANQYGECLGVWKEMAGIEPDNEEFALRIMQAYVRNGNRVGAINHYRSFETSLWSSLGISPNEELKRFYREILEHPQHSRTTVEKCSDGSVLHPLRIVTRCIRGIDYFWISDVVAQLIAEIKEDVFQLQQDYIYDLGYIQREIIFEYREYLQKNRGAGSSTGTNLSEGQESGSVPPVRVSNAFCRLILQAAKKNGLTIEIKDAERMDTVSENLLEYLESLEIPGLRLERITQSS